MSAASGAGRTGTRRAVEVPAVVLACTACELVYEPDRAAFGSGRTGCPECGGWTWIAQLGPVDGDAGSGR